MTVWKASKHTLLNNNEQARKFDLSLTVLDGGAAGKMFEPFDKVQTDLKVILFEPRTSSISKRDHVVQHIPGGIWNEREVRKLHVAHDPSTSSIYPPNLDFVKTFSPKIGYEARKTIKEELVELYSLDYAIKNDLCDLPNFIKLDVHSAEFEAIQGSINSLDDCLGFLVETWNYPVHLGQKLSGEVEVLLNSLGFFQYYSHPNSRWLHEDGLFNAMSDRRHMVGSEILFFRQDVPSQLYFKYLSLLELFGYGVLAIQKYKEAVLHGHINEDRDFLDALITNRKMRNRENIMKSPLMSARLYMQYLKNKIKYS